MLPSQLIVRNYRGYAGQHALDLRPLTLLFGRNNSGKSALLRALPLMSASAQGQGKQALDMSCPAIGGASFDELGWRHFEEDDELPRNMTLGLRWPDGDGIDLAFGWHDRRWVHVAAIRTSDVWYELVPNRGRLVAPLSFAVRGASDAFRVTFTGLTPTFEGNPPAGLDTAMARLVDFGGCVQWLGASRRPAKRFATYGELDGKPLIEHDGTNIIAWLAQNKPVLEDINAWYERNIRSRLHIEDRTDGFELMLTPLGRSGLDVNILDTGEGNVQVLPVLGAIAAAANGEGAPIVALEEPESHLHPRLQAALAQHIVDTIKRKPEARVILETHSEHMLLAMQKAVLDGLPLDAIRLYWVEQVADGRTLALPVEVREDGSLGANWPPGVFDDTFMLASKLAQLQYQRGST